MMSGNATFTTVDDRTTVMVAIMVVEIAAIGTPARIGRKRAPARR